MRQTKIYKEVSEVIDDGESSRYGGFITKEQRRLKRERDLASGKRHRAVKSNEDAGTAVVATNIESKESFGKKVEDFKEKTVVGRSIQSLKKKLWDESENPLIVVMRKITNKVGFLVYTGGELEGNGVYLFCSSELLGCSDDEILKILHNVEIGSDLIPNVEINNSLSVYNALESGWDQNATLFQEYCANGVAYYHVQSEQQNKSSGGRVRRAAAAHANPFACFRRFINCNSCGVQLQSKDSSSVGFYLKPKTPEAKNLNSLEDVRYLLFSQELQSVKEGVPVGSLEDLKKAKSKPLICKRCSDSLYLNKYTKEDFPRFSFDQVLNYVPKMVTLSM